MRKRFARGHQTDAIFRIEIVRRIWFAVEIESAFSSIEHSDLGECFGGVAGESGVQRRRVDKRLEDGAGGALGDGMVELALPVIAAAREREHLTCMRIKRDESYLRHRPGEHFGANSCGLAYSLPNPTRAPAKQGSID